MRLTQADYESLEKCYITPEYADAAGLRRVDSLEGRERVGRNGSGSDFSGLIFPYRDPLTGHVVGERLRLDHPPIDSRGKLEHKYLQPPGQRNHFYAPLADPAWFQDAAMPILFVEGEKAYLATHRAAVEGGQNGKPLYCAIALGGVYNWKGVTGKKVNAAGHRVDEKGPIPDWDKLVWKPDRRAVISFDSNAESNDWVRAARAQLSRELVFRGAAPFHLILPRRVHDVDVNGPDDFLAAGGLQEFLALYWAALRWGWHSELAKSKTTGKVTTGIDNAITALHLCPELTGLAAFNEFAQRTEASRETPWRTPAGPWGDRDNTLLRAFLEKKGVPQSKANVADAIEAVARESPFHPVREYLDGLKWDGVARLDGWLTAYAGAAQDEYTAAVGAKWMISAVARVREPGSKADHVLILEGPQGTGKSKVFQILGGEFFSDDLAELGTKDSAMGVAGAWILELAELDSMARADIAKVKAFISRTTDRFRPPYRAYLVETPRQSVFAGSVNHGAYLKDETGGRRFWPIACGELKLDELAEARDQLWAEADVRYQLREPWWLETPELVVAATGEQEQRYAADPWEALVENYLIAHPVVTTSELLAAENCINKQAGQWTRADETRVGVILNRLGWEVAGRPLRDGKRVRIYCEKGAKT